MARGAKPPAVGLLRIQMQNVWKISLVMVMASLSAASARGLDLSRAHRLIDTELASANSVDTAKAVDAIGAMIEQDGFECRAILRDHWLPELMAKKQYSAVARFTKREVLIIPRRTKTVQQLLALHVEALLAMNRPQKALTCSKRLFNFCSLRDTSNALALVGRCIAAASPDGPAEVRELKRQQIAGAAFTPPGTALRTCPVLAAIRANGKAYTHRAWAITGQRYVNLIERGNLLLLAGRMREAMACYQAAYLAASAAGQWAEAASRIAACMKAEDGTVGRANTWAWSIRQP